MFKDPILAAIAVLATSVAPMRAAEINPLWSHKGAVVLTGNIVAGDYERLRDYAAKNPIAEILLESPGGDLVEAIKIGRLVRSLDLKTIIPDKFLAEELARRYPKDAHNYMCASACFFVFVGGVERDCSDPALALAGNAPLLGIHRPYMSEVELTRIDASDAMASVKKTRAVIEDYLKAMSVPSKYADRMFAVPKEQIQWISTEDFQTDFQGFIPELSDWMSARCDKLTDVEKALWEAHKDKIPADETPEEKKIMQMLMEKISAKDQCEDDALAELSTKARRQIFGGN